jgi:hypothetical protein
VALDSWALTSATSCSARQPRHLRRQRRDGSLANIEHIRDPAMFRFLQLDIVEPYFVDDEPIDFVYHLASPASPIDYLRCRCTR